MKKSSQNQFIELEVKKLMHIEAERKRLLTSAIQKMPEINFMRCPRCSRSLEEKTISDIALIICTQCKGIWIEAESLAGVLNLSEDKAETLFNFATK
ncbi:MAG: zf-TFIIB domain-containing protein [Deltaproteobacteria bacterium]|nr:zf-TFIIB domain-containing protein [Deltaproteobacteria bacterium]